MSISQVAQIHVKIRERTKLASLIMPAVLVLQKPVFYPKNWFSVIDGRWQKLLRSSSKSVYGWILEC